MGGVLMVIDDFEGLVPEQIKNDKNENIKDEKEDDDDNPFA
jgi:hypothetical protein